MTALTASGCSYSDFLHLFCTYIDRRKGQEPEPIQGAVQRAVLYTRREGPIQIIQRYISPVSAKDMTSESPTIM